MDSQPSSASCMAICTALKKSLRFLMKTLKTWLNPFLFADYLLKRELVCKLCGANESSQSTAHILFIYL